MYNFFFRFTRLRTAVNNNIVQDLQANKESKVVYLLPYDTSLVLSSLYATVQKHQLPWHTDLLTHQGYGAFNNAPVLFLQHGDYLSAETNPAHKHLLNNLKQLLTLGDDLVIVLVYPHWGSNIITKESLPANASSLSKAWHNSLHFLKLRKFAYINLYQHLKLRDLVNLMLAAPIDKLHSDDLQEILPLVNAVQDSKYLTDLDESQSDYLITNLATYLLNNYQEVLKRRNSNQATATRKEILAAVLQDNLVQEAIVSSSKKSQSELLQNSKDFKAQQDKAYEIIDEIASDVRFSTLKFYDFILRKLWKRFYSGISFRGLDRISETLFTKDNVSLTYVSTHRSHIDYLLLSYILNEYGGIKTPNIAAGINLNFWPVGKLFRRGGAFFLRRSFNNYLYAVIFRTYIAQLIKNQQDLEFFIEGGRSRTGRLLTPKTGMLNMTIEGFLRSPHANQYFVPIFIAYDKVFESSTYVAELMGKAKNKENALLVLRNLRRLKYQGQVHVNFARPLQIANYLYNYWPNWLVDSKEGNIDKAAFENVSNALAQDIATSINANATISNKALFAAAIFNTDGNFNKAELAEQISFIQEIMQKTQEFNPGYAVMQTSSSEIINSVVKVCSKNIEVNTQETLKIKSKALAEFNYYRNNVEHCFIAPALAAMKLEKSLSDEQLQGFCYYFADVFNFNSFTTFTPESLFKQVQLFAELLSTYSSAQRQLFAKQLTIYLQQLDTFMTQMVEALVKLQAEGKGIEQLKLSTITEGVITKLKEVKSPYPDFADKTTINQLRNAFTLAQPFINITADQLVEALSYVHAWLK